MRAMRAESFTRYGGLKLVEVPRPTLADGGVLVRITAAGVSPLDHTILSGGYPRATAPLILGNERAGVVENPAAFTLLRRQALHTCSRPTKYGMTRAATILPVTSTPTSWCTRPI